MHLSKLQHYFAGRKMIVIISILPCIKLLHIPVKMHS